MKKKKKEKKHPLVNLHKASITDGMWTNDGVLRLTDIKGCSHSSPFNDFTHRESGRSQAVIAPEMQL